MKKKSKWSDDQRSFKIEINNIKERDLVSISDFVRDLEIFIDNYLKCVEGLSYAASTGDRRRASIFHAQALKSRVLLDKSIIELKLGQEAAETGKSLSSLGFFDLDDPER